MRMSVEEFLRTWDGIPDLKNAELIEGVVYVSSPVGLEHGLVDGTIHYWLRHYASYTPGCEMGANATCLMLESASQPDAFLRVREAFGGRSRALKDRLFGAPELTVEICASSTEVDFGPKLALYQRAGVQEYLTLELMMKRVQWRSLEDGSYRLIEPDAGGVLRSSAFPGLWLDTRALWNEDDRQLLASLDQGIASEAHAQFIETLRSAHK